MPFCNKKEYIDFLKTLSPNIFYINNKEYRQYLRNIFRMESSSYTNYADLSFNKQDLLEDESDEETLDELNCDMDALSYYMELIYEDTICKPIFKQLYLHAAARMFSEDPNIGQSVLCSYDTFHWYFSCIWHFYSYGSIHELPEYLELRKYLNL
jgi:hypothetical protein